MMESMIQPKAEYEIPKEQPQQSSLVQSTLSLDEVEQAKIRYIEKMTGEKYTAYQENLMALMNMGFTDFDKNLDLL